MKTNYFIEGLVVLLVALGIIYLINRNKKDLSAHEKEINASEINPTKKDDKQV